MFLNQNAAYAHASKMAAQMKAKENAKKRLCKQGSQKRLINPAKTKKAGSSSSLSSEQKLAKASSFNRRGSIETLHTHTTATTANSDATPLEAVQVVSTRSGCDDSTSAAGSILSTPASVAGSTVSIAAGTVISNSSGRDVMTRDAARKYVERVMIKVVEVEQHIDMKLTATQFAKGGPEADKLSNRHKVVIDAISSLEDLLQSIEISPSSEEECEGIKQRVKEIRSTFAEK